MQQNSGAFSVYVLVIALRLIALDGLDMPNILSD